MAADLLGRRRTLIFGGVLGVFSALAMASAPGLGLICTAMALKALGCNMLSGTAEALIYDSLKMAGREKDYIKVDANASICMKNCNGARLAGKPAGRSAALRRVLLGGRRVGAALGTGGGPAGRTHRHR